MVAAQKRYMAKPENGERRKAYMAEYRSRPEVKARGLDRQRERYQGDDERREEIKAYVRSRRDGYQRGHTVEQWKALKAAYGNRCAYCGERRPLTKDHIVPLSQGDPLRVDSITNIVPVCRPCNSRKHVGRLPKTVQAMML